MENIASKPYGVQVQDVLKKANMEIEASDNKLDGLIGAMCIVRKFMDEAHPSYYHQTPPPISEKSVLLLNPQHNAIQLGAYIQGINLSASVEIKEDGSKILNDGVTTAIANWLTEAGDIIFPTP